MRRSSKTLIAIVIFILAFGVTAAILYLPPRFAKPVVPEVVLDEPQPPPQPADKSRWAEKTISVIYPDPRLEPFAFRPGINTKCLTPEKTIAAKTHERHGGFAAWQCPRDIDLIGVQLILRLEPQEPMQVTPEKGLIGTLEVSRVKEPQFTDNLIGRAFVSLGQESAEYCIHQVITFPPGEAVKFKKGEYIYANLDCYNRTNADVFYEGFVLLYFKHT